MSEVENTEVLPIILDGTFITITNTTNGKVTASRFGAITTFQKEHFDIVFASISHPYFKLRWIPPGNVEEARDSFLKLVCELNQEVNNQDPKQNYTDRLQRQKDDAFFLFLNDTNIPTEGQTLANKIRLQCHQYFEDPEKDVDMLLMYPYVKKAFIKFNTPLPSSGPVERLFNFAGMIFSPKRRKLTDGTFEQLVLLKANANW